MLQSHLRWIINHFVLVDDVSWLTMIWWNTKKNFNGWNMIYSIRLKVKSHQGCVWTVFCIFAIYNRKKKEVVRVLPILKFGQCEWTLNSLSSMMSTLECCAIGLGLNPNIVQASVYMLRQRKSDPCLDSSNIFWVDMQSVVNLISIYKL